MKETKSTAKTRNRANGHLVLPQSSCGGTCEGLSHHRAISTRPRKRRLLFCIRSKSPTVLPTSSLSPFAQYHNLHLHRKCSLSLSIKHIEDSHQRRCDQELGHPLSFNTTRRPRHEVPSILFVGNHLGSMSALNTSRKVAEDQGNSWSE